MTAAPPTLVTRAPTGKPPWPMTLIAGTEKSGKSWACAVASASTLIGRTYWVSIGEDDPDELGALPGARFEIVEHDGTYRGILAAITAAAAQPAVGGKPNLIVLDSATRLWDLLCDAAQHDANQRAATKARNARRPVSEEDATITMDQWNTAKQRWQHCIDAIRSHVGPVLITARLEQVTILNAAGQPTAEKAWKVKAEKSLPFDVGAVVEMHARADTYLAGVRSVRFTSEAERTKYPEFTVEKLWTDLGLAEKDATSPRQHTPVDAADKPMTEADAARADLVALCEQNGWDKPAVAALYADVSAGADLRTAANAAAIRAFTTTLPDLINPKEAAA